MTPREEFQASYRAARLTMTSSRKADALFMSAGRRFCAQGLAALRHRQQGFRIPLGWRLRRFKGRQPA